MTSQVTYGEALEMARGHHSPDALDHSVCVAETAVRIAEAYGIDTGSARLAGLLHDWARDLEGDVLVAAARTTGLEVSDLDLEVPYLLHARVGAAQVQEILPDLPGEVVRAVATHTCGAGSMSALEKVVYVADMIEPARTFKAVRGLRDAVGSVSLDELFRLAYTRSLEHLIETRRHIHPDTVAVWNAQVAGGEGP